MEKTYRTYYLSQKVVDYIKKESKEHELSSSKIIELAIRLADDMEYFDKVKEESLL